MKHKNLKLFSIVIFSLLFIFSASQNIFGQLTKVENKIPKNVPLKIEIKNYGSENWVKDLKIVVTNTGDKPIYLLNLNLITDATAEDGYPLGFPFIYGNTDLSSIDELARETDTSILPKKSYTFKVEKDFVDGWTLARAQGKYIEPQTAQLRLGWLSFGDGTGIKGGGTPYNYKKKT